MAEEFICEKISSILDVEPLCESSDEEVLEVLLEVEVPDDISLFSWYMSSRISFKVDADNPLLALLIALVIARSFLVLAGLTRTSIKSCQSMAQQDLLHNEECYSYSL